MSTFVDLIRQVQHILPKTFGGSGNAYGYASERMLLQYMNDTGSTIALGTLVKLKASYDDTRVIATTAIGDLPVGVVVGRFTTGGVFVAEVPPDESAVAVCVAGRCDVLVSAAVSVGEWGYVGGTAGKAIAAAAPAIGTIGQFESSTAGAGTATIVLTGGAASFPQSHYTINFIISGGTTQPATGIQGIIKTDVPGTIVAAHLFQTAATGACQVSLKTATLAVPTPTFANIVGSNPLVLSAAKGSASTLSGWTTTLATGDLIEVTLDSITVITTVTMALKIKRTG